MFKDFPKDELYLCHNDCYYLNTLFDKNKKKLSFIDFEYSGLNPFGSDIVHIMNECTFDYSVTEYPYYVYDQEKLPKEEDIKEMIRALFTFWDNKDLRFRGESADDFVYMLKSSREFHQISDDRVEKHYKLIKKFALVNCYFYLLWTLYDLKNKDFVMDFLMYAADRAKLYLAAKESYFAS